MLGAYSTIGLNQTIRFTSVPPDYFEGDYHGRISYSLGVKFSRFISRNAKIELAACYSVNRIAYVLPKIYNPEGDFYLETIKIFNVPIIYKRYFNNSYFLDFGTIIDIGLPRSSLWTDTQTGFGLIAGAGKEFSMRDFTLDISPNMELHSLLPFSSVEYQQRLLVIGFKVELTNKCH
jgi:hypothetical protein